MFDDRVMLDRRDRRTDPTAWSASSDAGVIATAHYRATEAGARMLAAGGNAIDAAVAAGLALGVVEPAGSGLGGMAVMVVHLTGSATASATTAASPRTFVISGPCRAPRAATPEQFVAGAPRKTGYRAIAVPSHVATLAHALRTHGTLPGAQVLQPAIELARDGHAITPLSRELMHEYGKSLAAGTAGPAVFDADGAPPDVGAVVRRPALAATLQRMAEAGFEDFYTGDIARRIVADMDAHGGFITADDLADIPWPTETDPLRGRFDGDDVCTAGPPAGGVTLVHMLNLVTVAEEAMGRRLDPDRLEDIVALAALIRRARKDRRRFARLGDSGPDRASVDFARDGLAKVRDLLPVDDPSPAGSAEGGSGETTQVSVVDRHGNAVALTQSIERSFGSKCATADLGFLYNGYMQAFKVQNREHPHYLRPGAVARSNASPTLLLRDGRVDLVIGNTGSERMASAILGAMIRLRAGDPFAAVAAPRLHCTPERVVMLEADRFDPAVRPALKAAGFRTDPQDAWAFKFGGMQLVARVAGDADGDSDRDRYTAVADPRRDGAAAASPDAHRE